MIYVISIIVSFVAVFLKGFQQKNVIANRPAAAFVTSYAMAAFDVATIYIIIEGDWWVALSAGTGAAFGIVTAMKTHDRIFRIKPSEKDQ